jgi:hypothetical protein
MLKRIRLELARTHNHPNGRRDQGFIIIAPLTSKGYLAEEEWDKHCDECLVTKFEGTQEHRHGLLNHTQTGHKTPRVWSMNFDDTSTAEGFRFETEQFLPGEYVSVALQDEEPQPFAIVSVTPADQPAFHRTHL